MVKKSIWLDRGTEAIVEDYQKKTNQSYSRTVCLLINNCVKYGKEDMFFATQTIEKYREIIKKQAVEIAELKLKFAEVKEWNLKMI